MKLRLLSTILAITCIFGAVSLPSGASSTVTPYAQMKTAISDANAEQSVRVTTTAKMSGLKILQVTDAGRNSGRQSITLTKLGYANTVKVVFIAGQLYVKGDASILTSYLGLSQANANELGGQWFGIPKSSGYYAQVAAGLTISTGMAEVTMTSSVTNAPTVKLDGVQVDVLKGTSVKTSLQPSFKETLYTSIARKPLPVEVTQNVQGSLGTISFSDWNEKVDVTAPKVTLHLN
jgi:hypothetical protein